MISRVVLVLQNSMDILKVEPGFLTSCDVIQNVDIKVEENADIKEEGDEESTECLLLKSEDEVSCVCTCLRPLLGIFHKCADLSVAFHMSICLST
jgi:hypothetical protein